MTGPTASLDFLSSLANATEDAARTTTNANKTRTTKNNWQRVKAHTISSRSQQSHRRGRATPESTAQALPSRVKVLFHPTRAASLPPQRESGRREHESRKGARELTLLELHGCCCGWLIASVVAYPPSVCCCCFLFSRVLVFPSCFLVCVVVVVVVSFFFFFLFSPNLCALRWR
jgi:hypothetical protein